MLKTLDFHIFLTRSSVRDLLKSIEVKGRDVDFTSREFAIPRLKTEIF